MARVVEGLRDAASPGPWRTLATAITEKAKTDDGTAAVIAFMEEGGDLAAEANARLAALAPVLAGVVRWYAEVLDYAREIQRGTHPGDAQMCAEHIEAEALAHLADLRLAVLALLEEER